MALDREELSERRGSSKTQIGYGGTLYLVPMFATYQPDS